MGKIALNDNIVEQINKTIYLGYLVSIIWEIIILAQNYTDLNTDVAQSIRYFKMQD